MHLGSCCCFWATGSSYEVADRDPVLLVSGLAGSILNSKKKILGISYETRVWVRLFLADLEFRNELWSVYNPDTGWLPFINLFLFHLFVWLILIFNFFFSKSFSGYVEPLEEGVEIVVPENDHGLYAIDILDPSLVSFS